MVFKMIRDLTWRTLVMVSTVWAIAAHLGDIEANFAPPEQAHTGQSDGGVPDQNAAGRPSAAADHTAALAGDGDDGGSSGDTFDEVRP